MSCFPAVHERSCNDNNHVYYIQLVVIITISLFLLIAPLYSSFTPVNHQFYYQFSFGELAKYFAVFFLFHSTFCMQICDFFCLLFRFTVHFAVVVFFTTVYIFFLFLRCAHKSANLVDPKKTRAQTGSRIWHPIFTILCSNATRLEHDVCLHFIGFIVIAVNFFY